MESFEAWEIALRIEIAKGKQLADQLKNCSETPQKSDFLAGEIVSSHDKMLSILNGRATIPTGEPSITATAKTSSSADQGCYRDGDCRSHGELPVKKRKIAHQWTEHIRVGSDYMVENPPDGYSWRKYGQKGIIGSGFKRDYYKCAKAPSCLAKKHVQRLDEDPSTLEVKYTGTHTCSQASYGEKKEGFNKGKQLYHGGWEEETILYKCNNEEKGLSIPCNKEKESEEWSQLIKDLETQGQALKRLETRLANLESPSPSAVSTPYSASNSAFGDGTSAANSAFGDGTSAANSTFGDGTSTANSAFGDTSSPTSAIQSNSLFWDSSVNSLIWNTTSNANICPDDLDIWSFP